MAIVFCVCLAVWNSVAPRSIEREDFDADLSDRQCNYHSCNGPPDQKMDATKTESRKGGQRNESQVELWLCNKHSALFISGPWPRRITDWIQGFVISLIVCGLVLAVFQRR